MRGGYNSTPLDFDEEGPCENLQSDVTKYYNRRPSTESEKKLASFEPEI